VLGDLLFQCRDALPASMPGHVLLAVAIAERSLRTLDAEELGGYHSWSSFDGGSGPPRSRLRHVYGP
jgi:hypothetical protein